MTSSRALGKPVFGFGIANRRSVGRVGIFSAAEITRIIRNREVSRVGDTDIFATGVVRIVTRTVQNSRSVCKLALESSCQTCFEFFFPIGVNCSAVISLFYFFSSYSCHLLQIASGPSRENQGPGKNIEQKLCTFFRVLLGNHDLALEDLKKNHAIKTPGH